MSRVLRRTIFVVFVAATFCTQANAQAKKRSFQDALTDIDSKISKSLKEEFNLVNRPNGNSGIQLVQLVGVGHTAASICREYRRVSVTFALIDRENRQRTEAAMLCLEEIEWHLGSLAAYRDDIKRHKERLETGKPEALGGLLGGSDSPSEKPADTPSKPKLSPQDVRRIAIFNSRIEAIDELIAILRPLSDRTKSATQRLDEFIMRKY